MKKFYLLMMFALLGMVANAAEVVSTFKSGLQGGIVTAGQVIPSDQLTWTVDKAIYVGWDGNDNRGAQFGSSSNAVKDGVTLQTTETFNNVKKVEVFLSVASKGSASVSTFVGETQMGVATDFSNTDPAVYTFEGDPVSGNVSFVLNSKVDKAMYVQKVVIYSEEADPTQVATPTFSVEGGEYYNTQSIALSCATADASIFYTINDGVETAYQAPIELNESDEYTIKAWATKEGLENSEVVSKTYTLKIGEQPMNLELNIGNYCTNAGIDNSDVVYEIIYNNVIFAATDGGSNSPKYYTSNQTWRIYTNGSLAITAPEGYFVETVNFEFGKKNIASVDNGTWDNSSSAWTASDNTQSVKFNIGGTTEIKSITVVLKEADSNQVLAPTFSVEAGDIYPDTEIAINCATEGATIKYILDGEAKEYVYSEPLTFETGTTVTITAWAEAEGLKASEKVVATYNVVEKPEGTDFVKVTDLSQLKDGDRVIIACESQNTILAAPDSDVRGYVEFGLSESFTLPGTSGASILTLGIENGQYTFFDGTYYLALTSDGNKLHSVDMIGNDAYWTIEINAGETTITSVSYSARSMKYNASDPRFACYETGQESVSIYREPNGSSSVNDAVANEFKAVAVANGIEVNVAEAGLVSVYNAAGQLVANVNVAEGATTINVAGGFYIVKAGNNVAKVLVK